VYIRDAGNWWEILTMNPDGSDPTVVVDRVSRGGDLIAVWINTRRNRQIGLIRPDQPDATPLWLTKDKVNCADPCWSPDGQWIAFTRGKVEQPSVWTARPDGQDLQRLTVGDVYEAHASWS
jgi:Tol biopolymer transport system component